MKTVRYSFKGGIIVLSFDKNIHVFLYPFLRNHGGLPLAVKYHEIATLQFQKFLAFAGKCGYKLNLLQQLKDNSFTWLLVRDTVTVTNCLKTVHVRCLL